LQNDVTGVNVTGVNSVYTQNQVGRRCSQKVFLSSGVNPGKMSFANQRLTGTGEHTPFLAGCCIQRKTGRMEGWEGKPLGGGLELAKSKRNGATEVFRIGVEPLKPRFWSGFSGSEMN
jgi:hypothetical protein